MEIDYKDCRFGQLTRWWYAYIAAKMVQKTITSDKDVGAYWMIRPWFWQMLAEIFALGLTFLFRLAIMANPTLQWDQNCHTSDIHFMTCIQIQIICPIAVWNWWFSRTRPFAKAGDCQWVGQACQKSPLRKISSSNGSQTFWNWKCTA